MADVDVIVIGGGHAGCEAASAAARSGAATAIVTMDPATIGAMSCNPAIGGIGKGHIVREIDVFGGILAQAADAAAIHYRMLNRSRGSAVWGPRVQADRRLFRRAVQARIVRDGVRTVSGEVVGIREIGGRVSGISLSDGTSLTCRAVIIASGTFLGGRLFTGRTSEGGGRVGEPAANALAGQLRALARVRRLKTGTPPRLDGRTIDWSRLALQDSDADPWTMAPHRPIARNPQLFCAVTRTTPEVHEIIAQAGDQSPLYSGDISGAGPRYCPSIEDKVRRFGDRDGHQIFLEPESLDDSLIYPNGISTSLPPDVQTRFVRAIPGLRAAEIVQPGYAVEYDFLDPRQLDARLESRAMAGLFLAGQVNGTTGYEEAAGQGLVAGLNAAAMALGQAPVLFDRRDSYIGVMVDDLSLQGISEPYRMLTARAEHRLHLRSDNAEARLFPLARATGVLSSNEVAAATSRQERRASLAAGAAPDGDESVLADEVAATMRYRPYVDREAAQASKMAGGIKIPVPVDFRYDAVAGLSHEMVERLDSARPATLADAQRVRGISPAAITAVLAALNRHAA